MAEAPEDIQEVLRTKDWIVWNKESFPKLLRHLPNRQHLKGLRSVLHPISSLTEVNEGANETARISPQPEEEARGIVDPEKLEGKNG